MQPTQLAINERGSKEQQCIPYDDTVCKEELLFDLRTGAVR
jgi:hypothetical protein